MAPDGAHRLDVPGRDVHRGLQRRGLACLQAWVHGRWAVDDGCAAVGDGHRWRPGGRWVGNRPAGVVDGVPRLGSTGGGPACGGGAVSGCWSRSTTRRSPTPSKKRSPNRRGPTRPGRAKRCEWCRRSRVGWCHEHHGATGSVAVMGDHRLLRRVERRPQRCRIGRSRRVSCSIGRRTLSIRGCNRQGIRLCRRGVCSDDPSTGTIDRPSIAGPRGTGCVGHHPARNGDDE